MDMKNTVKTGKRKLSAKPLTYRGFIGDSRIAELARKSQFDSFHVKVFSMILKNWFLPEPMRASKFDAEHNKYGVEIGTLLAFDLIKREQDIYRPTGRGLGYMVLLAAPGSINLVKDCDKAYRQMRKSWLENPEHAAIKFAQVQDQINFTSVKSKSSSDANYLERVCLLLTDLNVCQMPQNANGDVVISVMPLVRGFPDLWSLFLQMFSLFQEAAQHVSQVPESLTFNPSISALARCPNAENHFRKMCLQLPSEPADAITSARSMLEATLKWIYFHVNQGEQLSSTGTSGQRLKACLKLLVKDVEWDKPGVADMIRGMETALNGLDAARNAMGSAHGAAPNAPVASVRTASLIAGLATHASVYLLESYEAVLPL